MPTALPTFVLVHGAASNSHIWVPLQRELALRGQRSLALDLPGTGTTGNHPASYYKSPQDIDAFAKEPSGVTGVTLDDWAGHVAATVRRVAEYGPVVLVGTSAGGTAISAAGNLVPEHIARVVYLSAWCLGGDTATVGEGMAWPEQQGNLFDGVPFPMVGDPAEQGFVRINTRADDPEYLTAYKAACAADATDDEFAAMLDLMEPDVNIAIGSVDCRVRADSWGTIPHSYVRLTEDRAITPATQDRMIAEADALTPHNPFEVRSIASSHAGFFHRPGEFADVLCDLDWSPR